MNNNKTHFFAPIMQIVARIDTIFVQNVCVFASQTLLQMMCYMPCKLNANCDTNRDANCEQNEGVFYIV